MGPDEFSLDKLPDNEFLIGLPDHGDHPGSFLDSFSEKARDFLKNHPTVKKIWEGANTPLAHHTPEMGAAIEDFSKEHPIIGGIGKTALGAMESFSTPLSLGLMGAGAAAPALDAIGLTKIPKVIRGASRTAGAGFGALGAKEAYEGYKEGDFGKVLGGGLGLGMGTLGALHSGPEVKIQSPEVKTEPILDASGNIKTHRPLALPPASGAPIENTFIGGPSGESGQVALGSQLNPEVAAQLAGIVNKPSSVGTSSTFDPAVLAEQDRIKNLSYGPEAHYPGSRLTLPDREPSMPPESGDIRGGFSPESNAVLPYPENVVPNVLRPRNVQANTLRTAGEPAPVTSEENNIEFRSGAPEVTEDYSPALSKVDINLGPGDTNAPAINPSAEQLSRRQKLQTQVAQFSERPAESMDEFTEGADTFKKDTIPGPESQFTTDENVIPDEINTGQPKKSPEDAQYDLAREKFGMGLDKVKPVPFPTIPQEEGSRLYQAADHDNATEQDIPIDKIVSTQDTYQPDIVADYKNGSRGTEIPQVMEHDGKYYLIDGTHRSIEALENGESTIKAKVSKVNPDLIDNPPARQTYMDSLNGMDVNAGSNRGTEDYTRVLNTPESIPASRESQIVNEAQSHLDRMGPEETRPPMDFIANSPQRAESPQDVLIPPPGGARTRKDISAFRAEFGSADRTLESRPESAPIVKSITEANDQKMSFIASTMRELLPSVEGLDKPSRLLLYKALEGQTDGIPPEILQRAGSARKILDTIFDAAKIKSGKNINYLQDYITHIEKMGNDDLASGLKQIFDYHLGKDNPLAQLFTSSEYNIKNKGGSEGDIMERGLGNPDSPFRKERLGKINELEQDPLKLFRVYVESMGKLIYDAPAVAEAKKALGSLPDSNTDGTANRLKDLAQWYIKNYTRYDAYEGLNDAWNQFARQVNRTTSRSMLGFSTGLQSLHAARLVGNLWPELGTKYGTYGLSVIKDQPIQAWHEAAKLGLLQNEIMPFAFKTAGEKFDSVSNFLSAADYMDKAVGYHGFKKMFMDQGLSEPQAQLKALAATKRASLTSDPARPIRALNEEGASGAATKLAGLYKTVPIKMVEQYMNIASQAKSDPAKAARLVTGIGLLLAGAEAGAHVFHLSPSQFALQMGGAFGSVMTKIGKDLAKGDWQQAAMDTALWVTPGGMSVKRQYQNGLSAIEGTTKNTKLRFAQSQRP